MRLWQVWAIGGVLGVASAATGRLNGDFTHDSGYFVGAVLMATGLTYLVARFFGWLR